MFLPLSLLQPGNYKFPETTQPTSLTRGKAEICPDTLEELRAEDIHIFSVFHVEYVVVEVGEVEVDNDIVEKLALLQRCVIIGGDHDAPLERVLAQLNRLVWIRYETVIVGVDRVNDYNRHSHPTKSWAGRPRRSAKRRKVSQGRHVSPLLSSDQGIVQS